MVSGPFRGSSRGTTSKICRLWVSAAVMAVAVTVVRAGSVLASSSLMDTRSLLSLEMMTGEVSDLRS